MQRTVAILGPLLVGALVGCGPDAPEARKESADAQPTLAASPNDVDEGEWLFLNKGCATCHAVEGLTKELVFDGPSLVGAYGTERPLAKGGTVRMDEAWIKATMLDPSRPKAAGFPAIMPSYAGVVTPEEADAIAAFLRRLSG